jgi:hypothetical protein
MNLPTYQLPPQERAKPAVPRRCMGSSWTDSLGFFPYKNISGSFSKAEILMAEIQLSIHVLF